MKSLREFDPSPTVSIAAVIGSIICWHLVGELRWGFRPWQFQMPSAVRNQLYYATKLLESSALCLAIFAVIWTFASVAQRRTRPRIGMFVMSVISFLLSLVP